MGIYDGIGSDRGLVPVKKGSSVSVGTFVAAAFGIGHKMGEQV